MALTEDAKKQIEDFKVQFQNHDVDDLLRFLNPEVNPPKNMVPAAKRAAEELIQQKQLQQISPNLADVLAVEERSAALKQWRCAMRSLEEAEVRYVASDVLFITPNLWARHEALAEIERRRKLREDLRYWITTVIAVIALIVSITAYIQNTNG